MTPGGGTPASGQVALVVIDMQNSSFGLPGLADKRDGLLPPVNELIRAAHQEGRPVVLVRAQHERDRSTWTLNMLQDGQGFAFPGSRQSAFLDGLEQGVHVEVVKTRDSAFHGTDLRERLAALGAAHLLVCGVSTHNCVAQTAITGYAHNLHVAVAGDAVASESAELSAALLTYLQEGLRQDVLDQDASLRLLREGPRRGVRAEAS